MLEQHSNYNGHCRLPEHFWIKSTAQSHTIKCAEKITFLSLLQIVLISGKSCTTVRCVLKFRMEKTFSMHEVQLRKCSGKAAKERGKLVNTLGWELSEGRGNFHPKEPARYNLIYIYIYIKLNVCVCVCLFVPYTNSYFWTNLNQTLHTAPLGRDRRVYMGPKFWTFLSFSVSSRRVCASLSLLQTRISEPIWPAMDVWRRW
jgi:hypothetical protein